MNFDADVLVVGAGPVGLATCIEATLAGMSVIVIDPRATPADKACGEGLMPPALAALDRLGVGVEGRPYRGIAYLAPRAAAVADFRGGPGMGVRRTTLSTALAARAGSLGVERVVRPAGPVSQGEGWVCAGGVRGRWLVGADGLHSPIRRSLRLEVPARGPARYGLRRHYRVAPWGDRVEVHWSADAEAYVTPVAEDLVGVALLCPGGAPYEEWLGRFPALRDRLWSAPVEGTVRGAGPLRRRVRRRVEGRVLLVGDAAGYVDALTGEGIAVGLATSRELVRCLVAGDPAEYEVAWRRTTRRARGLTGALLWASQRPPLRGRIVPAAQHLPALFTAAVNQLAR